MPAGKPNILITWGDDIGISNRSCCSDGTFIFSMTSKEFPPRHEPAGFSVD